MGSDVQRITWKDEKNRSEPRKIATLITAHLVNDIYPHLYPGLLPVVLMPQLGFSIAAAGLISTVTALTTQLMQPILGLWADRIGGKMFVVGGLLVGSLIVPLTLGWAPTYILLLLGLLLGGIGNAAFHPHAAALMSEMTGKYKGSGMSFFMVGGNFGRLLAPLLASFGLYLGGRHGLWILAIPGLVMAVIMFLTMDSPVPNPHSGKTFTSEFFKRIKDRGGIKLLTIVGLRFMTVMSVVTLVPIMWENAGIKYGVYNLLLTVVFAAGMIGNLIGGTLSDFIGRKPVIIGSSILSTLWLVLFVNSGSIFGGFVLIALLGASLYSADPVVMVFSHQLFPENKGMASGITVGLGGMIGSLGVTLTGFISDIYSPSIGLYVAAAAILFSIPAVCKLKSS